MGLSLVLSGAATSPASPAPAEQQLACARARDRSLPPSWAPALPLDWISWTTGTGPTSEAKACAGGSATNLLQYAAQAHKAANGPRRHPRANRNFSLAEPAETAYPSAVTLRLTDSVVGFNEAVRLSSPRNASAVPLYNMVKPGAASEVHSMARDAILPSTAVFMLSVLVGSYVSKLPYAHVIPDTLCTMIVAGILGWFVRRLILGGFLSVDSFELVDASILNLVLLPIIIFHGSWSIHLPHFSSQFAYCLIFAVGGTIVTMVAVGYSSWYLGNILGWHNLMSFRANFAFAALISATDPMAMLSTYANLDIARRQPLLNTLVLGESLINDAVAIVFFNALNTFDRHTWHGFRVGIFEHMLILLFGSSLFGVFTAAILISLMRTAGLPGQTFEEILYMFMAPFLIFSMADTLGLSGIIAVLFAGIMFKTYGSQHLSSKGRKLASEFFEISAKLAIMGVFVLCGTSTALINSLDGFRFGITAVFLCLLGRALAVLVCTLLSNGLKYMRDSSACYISAKHGFMIWLGGLRGGVALVLALEIETSWCGHESKAMIINTTFIVICSLLLLCGGTTELFLMALGLVSNEPLYTGENSKCPPLPVDSEQELEETDEFRQLATAEDKVLQRLSSWLHTWFKHLLVGQSVEERRKMTCSDLSAIIK